MRMLFVAVVIGLASASSFGQERVFFRAGMKGIAVAQLPSASIDWSKIADTITKRPATLGGKLENWGRNAEKIINKAVNPNATSAELAEEYRRRRAALEELANSIVGQAVDARLVVDDVAETDRERAEYGTVTLVVGHVKADHTDNLPDERKEILKYTKPGDKEARDRQAKKLAEIRKVFLERRGQHLVYIPTSDRTVLDWRRTTSHAMTAVIQKVAIVPMRSRLWGDLKFIELEYGFAGAKVAADWERPALVTLQVVVKPVTFIKSVGEEIDKSGDGTTQPAVAEEK